MSEPGIVVRLRTIIREQLSEVERKQLAYFLIENANRMAHVTGKPTDEAMHSIANGERLARVLARLGAEAYALGYSEAVAALVPEFESKDPRVGRNGRGPEGSSPRRMDGD